MESNRKKRIYQIGNILGLIGTIIVNILANALPINNKTTGELSDAYPNLFVPAGFIFSIWGVIYLLLAIFVIFQARGLLKSEEFDTPYLDEIGIFFILASVANILWIFAWHYQLVGLSLIIMLILLIALLAIYLRLRIGQEYVPRREKLFVHVPFSVYLGWITIATIANVTAFLVDINWDGFGLSEVFWTDLVIIISIILTALILYTRKDIAYAAVVIWASYGIFAKQINNNFQVAFMALMAVIIVAALVIITIIHKIKKK
ncbi:MAG: hypothetical protein R6U96_00195 [Promethearchaeia archaeon]